MAFEEFNDIFFARWYAEFDQKIQEFKRPYGRLSPDERSELRKLMTQAAALSREFSRLCNIHLTVGVANFSCDPEGELVYSGCATLSPDCVLEALETWGRGEEYAPNPFPSY